ncbi:MAG: DnaJ domain-containing protein [Pseudomonadota bacterium]|nr:DnaJ domain-containing protein [Pseudomonadota bacterium]
MTLDPKRDGRRALFSLALDFYRQPLRHRGWVNAARPLPAGVGDLLASMAAGSGSLERRAASLGVTPEELREAGRFFIRQVWLVEGADPYRTLGLAPGASLEQVRDHYRKLIRLYHPDRAGALGEWDTAYAARINRAYRLLRDPGTRPDPVGRTQPAGGPVPKRRNSPGHSPTKVPSRRWRRPAILRWLFKTSRGEPGARPQRRPASRLFQRLGLGLSLAAVTASALFIAHHLIVLYASLAAEGLRPMPPLDVAGPSGLPASREAGSSCRGPLPVAAGLPGPILRDPAEQAALLTALAALPMRPAGCTRENGALGQIGSSRSVWTPYTSPEGRAW